MSNLKDSPLILTLLGGSILVTLLKMGAFPLLTIYAAGFPSNIADMFLQITLFQFIHGNFLHLLSNSILLVLVGPLFEKTLGTTKAAIVCVIMTIFIYASILMFSAAPVVGMSGLLMGILGYMAIIYRMRGNPEYRSMLLFLGLNVVLWLGSGISFIGHLSGAIIGVIAGFIGSRLYR